MTTPMLPRFDPQATRIADKQKFAPFGEHGDGKVYVYDRKTVFAVQVAQVTERPLLLRGPAGSGKSSLAPFVAHTLGCRFYYFTVSARTQARDLMWEFDALMRLNDANIAAADPDLRRKVTDLHNYLTPGVLWWAFNPETAVKRGARALNQLYSGVGACIDPATIDTRNPTGPRLEFSTEGAVVLIDEIDKADPDVPNNLLEALGSRQFTVAETKDPVEDVRRPLVIITTNNERQLPAAFLRRCIILDLKDKAEDKLVEVAHAQFQGHGEAVYLPIAKKIVQLRELAKKDSTRPPSTAEYLDAVKACIDLKIEPGSNDVEKQWIWQALIEIGMRKTPAASKDDGVVDA